MTPVWLALRLPSLALEALAPVPSPSAIVEHGRVVIGDAAAPGPIAWATYAGRRFAEELDMPDDRGDTPRFRREVARLEPGPSRLP